MGGHCLVRWKIVYRSRKKKGLRVKDLENMNIALLQNGDGGLSHIRIISVALLSMKFISPGGNRLKKACLSDHTH